MIKFYKDMRIFKSTILSISQIFNIQFNVFQYILKCQIFFLLKALSNVLLCFQTTSI